VGGVSKVGVGVCPCASEGAAEVNLLEEEKTCEVEVGQDGGLSWDV